MTKIKPVRIPVEIGMNLGGKDLIVKASCYGYHDPGRFSSPVEQSYPPETEFEASEITITLDDGTKEELYFDDGVPSEQKKILKALEDEFWLLASELDQDRSTLE